MIIYVHVSLSANIGIFSERGNGEVPAHFCKLVIFRWCDAPGGKKGKKEKKQLCRWLRSSILESDYQNQFVVFTELSTSHYVFREPFRFCFHVFTTVTLGVS